MPALVLTVDSSPIIAAPVCTPIPLPGPDLKMRFPFGLKVESMPSSITDFTSSGEQIATFLRSLQPALQPFMQALVLADMVKTVIDTVTSVIDSIAQLNPKPLIDALEKVFLILPKLLEFIPPLNYIPPIIDLGIVIITMLNEIISGVLEGIESVQVLQDYQAAVAANPELAQFEACVQASVDSQLASIAAASRTTAPLFGILATFLDLIGIGPLKDFVDPLKLIIGDLENLQGSDIDDSLVEVLEGIQDTLSGLKDALESLG